MLTSIEISLPDMEPVFSIQLNVGQPSASHPCGVFVAVLAEPPSC
jgi:hypothetical protein